MAGGALLNPRGPLAPGVYWRRRLVLLGATLAVLALLFSVSCADDEPDRLSYSAGARPVLTLSVSNAGPGPCTQDLGDGARELRWSRGRSAAGCPAGRPSVAPGSYQVIGRVGSVESAPVAFLLS